MCMSLHLSFKKNVKIFLKVVIWASKAKKWPCQAVLEVFQDMVKSLGKNLSFSSSLVNTGQHRKKLTYLGYYPTFSVLWAHQESLRPLRTHQKNLKDHRPPQGPSRLFDVFKD